MPHITKIVKYEPLSNAQFAVHIRCCNDPATDFPHTVATTMSKDEQKASIDAAREECARHHEGMLQSEQHAVELMGEEKTHE